MRLHLSFEDSCIIQCLGDRANGTHALNNELNNDRIANYWQQTHTEATAAAAINDLMHTFLIDARTIGLGINRGGWVCAWSFWSTMQQECAKDTPQSVAFTVVIADYEY